MGCFIRIVFRIRMLGNATITVNETLTIRTYSLTYLNADHVRSILDIRLVGSAIKIALLYISTIT